MGEEDKGYLHSSESGMSGFPRKNHHEAKLSFSFLLIGVPEATTTLATTPGASRSGKRLAQRSPGSKRDWGWADWVQSHLVLPEGGAPQLRMEMEWGRGRTYHFGQASRAPQDSPSLTFPRPSVSKLLQCLGHQRPHEPSEVLPAGLW